MKSKILPTTFIIAVIATISSCSTSYKAGQTPDDVYYSPARLQNDYVRTKTNDSTVYNSSNVYIPSEDREIRRRVHNRRWRRYDDIYDYPYGYNNYYPPVYVDPKIGATQNKSTPRKFNLGAYDPNAVRSNPTTQIDPKTGKPVNTSTTNSGSGIGNFIRKVFNGSGSSTDNSSSSNNSPTRTFDQRNNNPGNSNSSGSSNNSSSNKTSSGTNAPVRTFKNGN
jgi:hypothetical protein